MALTQEEKRRVAELWERLSEAEKRKRGESDKSFLSWLEKVAYSIFNKVRNVIKDVWSWLFG